MLQFTSFPACCTAQVLTGLGGSTERDFENMMKVGSKLPKLKDFAVITAITTATQVMGAKFLKEVGFIPALEANKDRSEARHKETGNLTVWVIGIDDWNKWQDEYVTRGREVKITPLQLKARQSSFAKADYAAIRAMFQKHPAPRGGRWIKYKDLPQFYYYHEYIRDGYSVSGSGVSHYPHFELMMKETFGYCPPDGWNMRWNDFVEQMSDWHNGFIQ